MKCDSEVPKWSENTDFICLHDVTTCSCKVNIFRDAKSQDKHFLVDAHCNSSSPLKVKKKQFSSCDSRHL